MNKKFPKQNENKNKKTALYETMETKNEVLRLMRSLKRAAKKHAVPDDIMGR